MKLKEPGVCCSIEEIREEIDKIDSNIISMFSERMKYVEEIVRFKTDEEGVVAAARKEQVINARAKWAENHGLDPDTFRKIYTLLVERNIQHELELLKAKAKS